MNNAYVDKQIRCFEWNKLIPADHLKSYELLAQKFSDIYCKSKRIILLKRRNPRSPWIDKEILELFYCKSRLHKKLQEKPDDKTTKEEFGQIRNKITAKIKAS